MHELRTHVCIFIVLSFVHYFGKVQQKKCNNKFLYCSKIDYLVRNTGSCYMHIIYHMTLSYNIYICSGQTIWRGNMQIKRVANKDAVTFAAGSEGRRFARALDRKDVLNEPRSLRKKISLQFL